MRDDALARNEVLLREVNEQIAAVSLAYADSDPTRSMARAREAMEIELLLEIPAVGFDRVSAEI